MFWPFSPPPILNHSSHLSRTKKSQHQGKADRSGPINRGKAVAQRAICHQWTASAVWHRRGADQGPWAKHSPSQLPPGDVTRQYHLLDRKADVLNTPIICNTQFFPPPAHFWTNGITEEGPAWTIIGTTVFPFPILRTLRTKKMAIKGPNHHNVIGDGLHCHLHSYWWWITLPFAVSVRQTLYVWGIRMEDEVSRMWIKKKIKCELKKRLKN